MATFCLADVISIVGTVSVQGTGADDEVISIELEDDNHIVTKGGDGVGYARQPYMSAKVTYRIRQDSDANTQFSAMFPNFGQGKAGSVSYPWITKDLSGLTSVSGSVKLLKHAEVGFGKELKSRVWVFHCAKVAGVLAGNSDD